MPNGLLLAAFDYSTAPEDEFNDWYDLEHIPERERVPGFLACERWLGAMNPKLSVATYDLETPEVLQSAPYRAISHENLSARSKRVTGMCKRLLRFEGEQLLPGDLAAPKGAAAILVVSMNVAPEHERDFNEWYNVEHLPALAAVPGTLSARRYRAHEGSHRYLALYHLASPEVPDSAAWKKAVETPWTARVRPNFRDMVRIVCRRYVRAK
jgi:hypothetical protein